MINFEEVSLHFGEKKILDDVSFNINYGEKIGLVGRNGTGKSTILKLILKQLETTDGHVTVDDYYIIGHLEQHINFSHNSVLGEVCSVLSEDRVHEEWKGEKILLGLGFSNEQMCDNPSSFSGGWQVKINLAKLLLMEPNMLLLDEPTNYLDIASIRWLGEFLKKWEGEVILITHDRAFMDSIITHTMIVHRQKVRKVQGKTGKLKDQIKIEEEIYEKTRIAQEKKRKETQDWAAQFGSKASKASVVKSKLKQLEKEEVLEKLDHIDTLKFDFNYLSFGSRSNILEGKNITFGYDENNLLIKDLSFIVEPNDKICVIGRNGNGKSTLLKLIVGDGISPISGDFEMHDKAKIGYFGQMNIGRLDPENTIAKEVESANTEATYGDVRRICSNMLFSGSLADKKISVLSGGEKSRVMLGKILLQKANLLLLDEPTNHFDMESCEALLEAILNFKGAVMMVTHDEFFLHEVANKLIVFDGGKTFVFTGTYKEFLKKVGWQDQ